MRLGLGEKDTLTIFAVNKSLDEDMEVSCDLRQFEGYKIVEHIVLNNDNLQAVNTETQPENVVPVKSQCRMLKAGRRKTGSSFCKTQLEYDPSCEIRAGEV